jgi:nifR3 family TIM-barrel protein
MKESLGYQLGKMQVKPGLVLAPMSGVTCRPFRRLIKELNGESLGLTVTEFISVEALTRNVDRSLKMMRKHESESPFCIQIFGFDIERMGLAAKMVEDAGADSLDINCGCPAPKVVRKGGGCELMRQPSHLGSILKKVRSSISIPLSLKMRSGWDQGLVNAPEIARIAESEGVDALAVHGRTRTQMYRGESDWNVIGEVVDTVKIPVLGSGDVVDYQSAKERLDKSKVVGLMVGRGALSNPLIFKEICNGGPLPWRGDDVYILSVLRRYVELLREELPEKLIAGRIKQLASGMCRGLRWRKALLTTQTQAQLDSLLEDPDRYLNGLPNSDEQAILPTGDILNSLVV